MNKDDKNFPKLTQIAETANSLRYLGFIFMNMGSIDFCVPQFDMPSPARQPSAKAWCKWTILIGALANTEISTGAFLKQN
jgi:hypothetical protein